MAAVTSISSASQRLSTVAAILIDDKEYATKLSGMCASKATTYDSRTKIRADELQALTQAVTIVKTIVSEKTSGATIRFAQAGVSLRLAKAVAADSNAMSAIEAEVEQAELPKTSLLATARRHRTLVAVAPVVAAARGASDAGRKAIESLLRMKGVKLKSTLLTALASKIAEDPFAKVKQLIQELIERLQKQAANESSQKGWCDKSIAEATQKREYAHKEVSSLNDKMALLEALKDQLDVELADLDTSMKENKDAQAEAETIRGEEKTESANTVKEAGEGLEALSQVIDTLDKFYKSAKNQASFVQTNGHKGPEVEAPDAGFAEGEAYTGAQGESGGIIGMLEIMKSDFQRTISETESAEKKAEQDQTEFLTESGKSLAEKEEAEKSKKSQLSDTSTELSSSKTMLTAEMAIITSALKELMELQPACLDTGMSYEERSTRRDDEVAALNQAICILGAFDEGGPTGVNVAAC
mmetsp:Transcript_150770/g.482503  ORF Transcript_150770/g.482503 Transcript_150770/m.482503 type:complete len:471 (+) Transcript_150770:861-2273(+)